MMYKQRYSRFLTVVAVILIASLLLPTSAMAAMPDEVMPLASQYLTTYAAYVGSLDGGDIQIWFRVVGAGYMTDIGALTIMLYESTDNENWTWVETFRHTEYESMLGHDVPFHMDCVDYEGVEGRYYKAYVCIWAGNDTDGDSRYFWTTAKQAI